MVYFGVFLLCFIKAVAPPFSGFVPALTDNAPFYVMPACLPPFWLDILTSTPIKKKKKNSRCSHPNLLAVSLPSPALITFKN